ncbi:DNA methyltransferase [Nocardia niigatensis]|uniref:DNA methyltransferase n=1 Tax=Nocardia niigatensis TaxID=209249 RepID=UPI0002E76B13|nr:DNA methyltransferase [Nocardia niigatensis]
MDPGKRRPAVLRGQARGRVRIHHHLPPQGRKRWNGGGKRAVWSAPIVIDRGRTGARLHTAQKPDKLMRALVEQFSDPGETILDAFAGSRSTLAAAALLGRKSSASNSTNATAKPSPADSPKPSYRSTPTRPGVTKLAAV